MTEPSHNLGLIGKIKQGIQKIRDVDASRTREREGLKNLTKFAKRMQKQDEAKNIQPTKASDRKKQRVEYSRTQSSLNDVSPITYPFGETTDEFNGNFGGYAK